MLPVFRSHAGVAVPAKPAIYIPKQPISDQEKVT